MIVLYEFLDVFNTFVHAVHIFENPSEWLHGSMIYVVCFLS